MEMREKARNNHDSTPDRSPSGKPPARAQQLLLFAQNFLKYPKLVGWVLPSSRFLVEEVLKQIDWAQARIIVEYGPGVGTFTRPMLERMRPDAKLVALEINPEFLQCLRTSLPDPRLHVEQASAADVDTVLARLGIAQADYVLSGIPFRTLSPPLRETIVQKTHSILRPQGSFLVYQFSGAVLPYLERAFSRVSRDFEWLNIIPMRLFFCAR